MSIFQQYVKENFRATFWGIKLLMKDDLRRGDLLHII